MTAPLAFHNGRFVPPGELTLSFADAGFVSAATVTDFCRTYDRRLFRWPAHLARLRRDCDALGLELPYPDAELTAAAERLVASAPAGELAVVTFVTPGPLGYLLGGDGNGPPTVGMHTLSLPAARYRRFFADGVTLAVAGELPTGLPPGVKHRSRLHWWLADRAVSRTHPGAVAVLTDAAGTPDTALASVLVVTDGTVVRPVGDVLGGISVTVVEELCGQLGLPFVVGPVDVRDLGGVSEVLIAGSGFGVAGVRRMVGPAGEKTFAWPGPVFTRLFAAWAELVGQKVEQVTFAE
ncbi:MAG: aminotransferase class IV [Gemmataceae bacterium]